MRSKTVKNVPVIMQMETVECGAAALSMLLAYYGKWVSLEQLRTDCGVSRDGSNARNIVLAARNYGMDAHGWRADIDSLEKMAPAIIHWNFNHFVVFKGFNKGMAFINDPSFGSMAVPMRDFSRSYTGIAITAEPGPDFKPSGHKTSIFHYIKENIKGVSDAFVFTLVMGILMAFVGMLYPLFSQVFLDGIITGKNDEWSTAFFLAMGGLVLFHFLLALLDNVYGRRFAGSMSLKGNARFLWHALNLPIEFYSQRYVGDIVDGHRKAELLRLIAQMEKVNLAQTIAVGDGANDLPMLSEAGLGIAFHAKPRVVANARQSINTIGIDGVLYFLGFKDSYLGEQGII